MRRYFSKKILLLCGLMSLVVLALVAASLYLVDQEYQQEKTVLIKQANTVLVASERHTIQVINEVNVMINGVRMMYSRTASISETAQYIAALSFDQTVIEDIYLADARGDFLIPAMTSVRSGSVADRDYFRFHQRAPADSLFISSVVKGRVSGEYRFHVTRRITQPDGSFGGVVIASVKPQSFRDYFRDLQIGPQSMSALVAISERKLIARIPEPSESIWDTPLSPDDILVKKLAQVDAGSFEAPSPADGIQRYYVFRKVANLPLVIVIGFSQADIDSRVAEWQIWLILVNLIVIVSVAVITATQSMVIVSRDKLAAANQRLNTLNAKLEELALYDALTGLPSRVLFTDRFHVAQLMTERGGKTFSLVFVDLDNFKLVNDQFGHSAGDECLKVIASRMRGALRSVDTICRWGGDEFLVLLLQDGMSNDAVSLTERLFTAISEPIVIQGVIVIVTASIGIAHYPIHGNKLDDLQKSADDAMYLAKKNGKARVVVAPHPEAAEDDY